jgi:GNAT superfamily N-acetyltransferase
VQDGPTASEISGLRRPRAILDRCRFWCDPPGTRSLWIAEDAVGHVVAVMVLAGNVVEQLYVDPKHTRLGVGSQLLA